MAIAVIPKITCDILENDVQKIPLAYGCVYRSYNSYDLCFVRMFTCTEDIKFCAIK